VPWLKRKKGSRVKKEKDMRVVKSHGDEIRRAVQLRRKHPVRRRIRKILV